LNLARGNKDDRAGGQVFLAAFGKHPGWNDHIEDIGIETEHLASLKQLLYVQGIGGVIDAGAWENLSGARRVAGFDHVLLCRTAGDVVVGRLWSSTDGKGRSRYPMVVCAQCANLPLQWVLREVLPRLAEVETRCKAVAAADEVIAIIDRARRELRELAESAGAGDGTFVVSPAAVADLADRPEMLPGHEGLLRILYQMERETGVYARGNYAAAARNGSPRPVQMRVPACGDGPEEVIPRWLSFLFTLLDQATEVWAICRAGQSWLDIIIGEPAPNQFFCFQASKEALPLASEIPYTLDDAFRTRAKELIDDSRTGELTQIVLRPAALAPWRPRKDAGEAPDRISSIGRSKALRTALIVLAILALLAGLAAALIAFWPVSGPHAAAPSPGGSGANGSTMNPADAKAWRDLCMESFNWFAPFLADANEARVERWRKDTHLAATIVPVLRKVFDRELVLDPKQIASVTGRHLKNLADAPPDGAQTPEGIEKTAKAVKALGEIRESLSPAFWPALANLKELAETYRKRNWLLQANYLAAVAERAGHITSPELGDQAPDLPGRIDDVLTAADKAAELEGLWKEVQQQADVLRQSGNAVLARFGDYVSTSAQSPAGAERDLATMAGRLKDARSLGEPLVAFVRDDWRDKIDMPTVEKDPLLSGPVAPQDLATGEIFPRWLASIRSEQFARLDPAADPRTKDNWAQRRQQELTALAGKIDDLKKKYSSPDAPALETQLAALQAEQKDLLAPRWDREHKSRIAEAAAGFPAKTAQLARQVGPALARAAGGRDAYVANIPAAISAQSEQLNKYWSRRSGDLKKLDDMARLTIKVEKLEKDLTELDKQLPPELGVQPQDKDWNRLLAGEVTMRHREGVLEKALSLLGWKDDEIVRDEAFEAEFKKLAGAFEAWKKQVADAMAAFNAIDDALRLGAVLDEKPAGQDKTIAQLAAEWRSQPIWRDKAVVEALGPVTRRVARLEEIAALSDPVKLASEAAVMATDHFEAARAAWKRLGQLPGWPADRESFNIERNLHRDLNNVYTRIAEKDPARGRQLADELVSQVRLRWKTYFLSLRDPGQIDVAVARADQFFLDANQAGGLSPACNFRMELRELRHEALDSTASPADDQTLRRRVSDFVSAVKKMPGLADKEPVAGLLAELSAIAASRDEGADLTKAGPALAGWKPQASRDGRSVRFDWPADRDNRYGMEFIRVEPQGKPAGYLCATETPVGLFIQVIAAGKHWPAVKKLLRTFDRPDTDGRLGPRTWDLNPGGELIEAPAWVRLPPGFNAADFYYAGAKVGSPGLAAPVQHLSVAGAVCFARLLGCRLPASDEWAAAKATLKGDGAAGANLRDQAWQRQKDHIQKLEEAGRLSSPEDYYPDAGAFWPKGAQRLTGRDAKSRPGDDGMLWLAPVGNARPGEFQCLVGNVAEFTFDDPAALTKWQDDADQLKQLLAASADKIRVIGGSALSAPQIPVDVAQAVDYAEASAGYADVGLRLAFTAPAETVQVRLRRLLTACGYPVVVSK